MAGAARRRTGVLVPSAACTARASPDLVDADGVLPYIAPGVTSEGAKSRRDKLAQDQLPALRELGVEWA